MKTYSAASDDALSTIDRMRKAHHEELDDVTVAALFIFDDEESSEQVLTHGGYPAAATVKITNLRDRALGVADAVIVIDRAYWVSITAAERDALMDHELYHLERAREEESGTPKIDAIGRPKLEMRKHDRQFGWFDEIARRHGPNSGEVKQASSLLAETEQLYFDFNRKPKAAT